MAIVLGKPIGHELAAMVSYVVGSGYFQDVDGPTSVATANGNGQRANVGEVVRDDLGNAFIYLPGVASLAQGDWVFYNQGNAFAPVRLLNDGNTGGAGAVAVAMAAIVANCWGWFQIFGFTPAFVNIATTASVNAQLYRSGTTARASVSAVAKDCIFGAITSAASVANVGSAALTYPYVTDQSTL